jgi:hypothetical protein
VGMILTGTHCTLLQLKDAQSDEYVAELAQDGTVIDVMDRCGISLVLKVIILVMTIT